MLTAICGITLLVNDIDDAIKFYNKSFGFLKASDYIDSNGFRVVNLLLSGSDISLNLSKAYTAEKTLRVGKQTIDIPYLSILTDNIKKDLESLKIKGVKIVTDAKKGTSGTEAVVEDLYGNRIALLQKSES